MLIRGLLVVLTLVAIVILAGNTSLAEELKPAVSLTLAKASAARQGQDTYFRCEALLDNATGQDLTIRSTFSSVCDGLELVVTTKEGKTLVQQPYTAHQAPFAPRRRDFTLKQGRTTSTLLFLVRDFPEDAKVVKVRLVGTLPESNYRRILSSETIEVKVKVKVKD